MHVGDRDAAFADRCCDALDRSRANIADRENPRGARFESERLAIANSTAMEYSRYGSTVHKQVYLYGGLDTGNRRSLPGTSAWRGALEGGLLTPFLQGAGAETFGRLRARVAAELTTTFASTYTREVSLAGMLRPDAFNSYVKRATGEKFLVTPQVLPYRQLSIRRRSPRDHFSPARRRPAFRHRPPRCAPGDRPSRPAP